MEHVNSEVIAMMAMADPDVSSIGRAHVFACDACRAEWEELSRIVKLARSAPLLDGLTAPRPAVWDRISAEVRNSRVSLYPDGPSDAMSADTIAEEGTASELDVAQKAPDAAGIVSKKGHLAPPRRRARSRRRSVSLALASAFAVFALVVGIGSGIAFTGLRSVPQAQVVASTTLQALPDWPTAQGNAKVETDSSGQRELVVTLSSVPASQGGFREVWIMSSSLKKLISLGVLVGDSGRFAMPADISIDAYPVVDVSEQVDNGSPAHSGNSIVRGTLS